MSQFNVEPYSWDYRIFQLPLPKVIVAWIEKAPLFWRFQIVGWILFSVLSFPLRVNAFDSIYYAVTFTLIRDPFGVLITCGFRRVYKRLGLRIRQPGKLACWVIFLSVFASAVDVALGFAVADWIHHESIAQGGFGVFCFRGMMYCCWSFLYFWIRDQIAANDHLLNLARARTAAQDAELLMLRAQVSPHFLFNSLNTILADLERRPLALVPVVQGLADYFRYSLTHRHDNLIPLGEEFDAIVNYLTVEKARFRETIEIECDIDPSVRNVQVPGIFLQPLVENALKYGHQTSPTPLRVSVSARESNGSVVVMVRNSGLWIEPPTVRPPGDPGGNGLGILRRRLRLLYSDQAVIHINSSVEEEFVIVQVKIPPSETSLSEV